MSLMTRKSEYRTVSPGTYYCQVSSIAPKTIPDGKGGETDGAEWRFTIYSEGPHYGDVIEAFTSLAWSAKSKVYGWATALLGYAPDPEEPIDIEQFVGAEAYVIVSVDEKRPERTRVSAVQRVIRDTPPPPPRPARQAPAAAPPSATSEASRSRKPKAATPAPAPVAPPPVDEDPDDIDF